MESLMKINDPILLALIATGFTWFMTALDAAMVFFFKEINKRVLNMMLGFAAGIMVAASFWSLLAPAIEMAEQSSLPAWLVAAIGFLDGAAFLWLADRLLPHAHFLPKMEKWKVFPLIGVVVFYWYFQLLCIIFLKGWRSALLSARLRIV